jgi:hypothetical protein
VHRTGNSGGIEFNVGAHRGSRDLSPKFEFGGDVTEIGIQRWTVCVGEKMTTTCEVANQIEQLIELEEAR